MDECRSDPLVCRYGRCRNTVGDFDCVCPDGFVQVSDDEGHGGKGCIDARRGACYAPGKFGNATLPCSGPLLATSVSRSACCCSVGAAWSDRASRTTSTSSLVGDRDCQTCPRVGSQAYKNLCPGNDGFQPNKCVEKK